MPSSFIRPSLGSLTDIGTPPAAALPATGANYTQYFSNDAFKGQQVGGFKIEPGTKITRYMPYELHEAIADGATVELQLGQVLDIVDIAGTALVVDKLNVVTPLGDALDLFAITRIKNDPQLIHAMPPGKWKITNVSGGAYTPDIVFHQIQSEEV